MDEIYEVITQLLILINLDFRGLIVWLFHSHDI